MSLLITGNTARANKVPNAVVGSGTASAESASSSVFLAETLGIYAVRVSSTYDSSGYSSKSALMPAKSTWLELLSSEDSSGSSSKSALMPSISALFSLLSVDDNSESSSKSLLMPESYLLQSCFSPLHNLLEKPLSSAVPSQQVSQITNQIDRTHCQKA